MNYNALVRTSATNTFNGFVLLQFSIRQRVCELNFLSSILNVRLNMKRLVVVLESKFIYLIYGHFGCFTR